MRQFLSKCQNMLKQHCHQFDDNIKKKFNFSKINLNYYLQKSPERPPWNLFLTIWVRKQFSWSSNKNWINVFTTKPIKLIRKKTSPACLYLSAPEARYRSSKARGIPYEISRCVEWEQAFHTITSNSPTKTFSLFCIPPEEQELYILLTSPISLMPRPSLCFLFGRNVKI